MFLTKRTNFSGKNRSEPYHVLWEHQLGIHRPDYHYTHAEHRAWIEYLETKRKLQTVCGSKSGNEQGELLC